MGEIANAILEGVFCQVCGEYLGEGQGFPVTCCGDDTENEDVSDDEAAFWNAETDEEAMQILQASLDKELT